MDEYLNSSKCEDRSRRVDGCKGETLVEEMRVEIAIDKVCVKSCKARAPKYHLTKLGVNAFLLFYC